MTVLNAVLELGRKEIILDKTACAVIGVVGFVILTICGAFVRIPLPFTPVPITLQTFSVLLAGAILGRRLGSISQTIYIILGALGLPIFSGAVGGLSRLFGQTGGYLIGFVLAAWVIGRLIGGKKASFLKILSIMFAGEVVLFSLGVIWLSMVLHVTLIKAVFLGLLPFIPGDAIKLLAATTLYYEIQGRVRGIYSE